MLALLPPARRHRCTSARPSVGALFAYALLAYALEQAGFSDIEGPVYTAEGKPYLLGHPVYFSLSHSKTHALCAVGDIPVGCDIETHRDVSAYTQRRILGAEEAAEDFFTYWTLKESYFKLHGDLGRPFSTVGFVLDGDKATGADAHGWMYREVAGCTAAVVAAHVFARPTLDILTAETIFLYAGEK